jgi:hypothetical protein
MLKAKANIQFTLENKDYDAHDRFWVAFKLGEDLLFSGAIKSSHSEYKYNTPYNVDVEFFTIDNDEAYELVTPSLKEGMNAVMCAGRRIIGQSTLTNLEYAPLLS